jgi:hypothetical protein
VAQAVVPRAEGQLQDPDADRRAEQLVGFYAGQQVVLVWDGLGVHWSHDLHAWLAIQRHWLQVERLPAYAPELNAVEYLWANLKGVELANFAGDTVIEVADAAEQGVNKTSFHSLGSVCQDPAYNSPR